MKKVLVLGAGLVARPLVNYILKKGYKLVLADITVSKAKALIQNHQNGVATQLDVNDKSKLNDLLKNSDIVISLLPYTLHVTIAKLCIKYSKNLITASYVSNEMKKLDSQAKEKGILFLNEIGLDPGIDHMSAMKVINEVKNNGGKVKSFRSYCGGLPAMQCNNNPFGYKFSWSPRGVVMAGRNNGQFLENNKVKYIPNKNLFKEYTIINIEGVGSFEAYTNRDSLPYKKTYGLDDAETIFRGTLRNPGWCYTMKKAGELGLFDDSPREDLKNITYRELVEKLIELEDCYDIIDDTAAFLGIESDNFVIKKLEWLGLFEDKLIPKEINNVMDVFCALLQDKLSMGKNDLDLVVLYHHFVAEYNDKKEIITSTLVDTGILNGDSAMARTVSLPVAIATKLILDGKINLSGVQIPVLPEIYVPVLEELEKMNIKFIERTYPLD